MTIDKSFWITSWNFLIRLPCSIFVSCDLKEVVNLIKDCPSTTLVKLSFIFKQIIMGLPHQYSLDKGQLRMSTCREK